MTPRAVALSPCTLLGPILLATACGSADQAAWCEPWSEGVEVVANSGSGEWGRGEARLVELWRAGGVNDGEDLAHPVSMAASPTGRVAIADFQLSEVVVIDRDGTWLGPWGRRGRGPGELDTPVAAGWDRSGRLAVFDVVAPKVVFLEDGDPARPDLQVDPSLTAPIVASGQFDWAGVQPRGDVLLRPTPGLVADAVELGTRAALLVRLRPGASAPDTLARTSIRTLADGPLAGWSLPGWPQLVVAVGTDGALAIGGLGAGYRVVVHDSAGTPVRQLCRDAPPLPITARERGDGATARPALAEAIRNAPLPDTPHAFGRLFWGAHGRLWVQRDRPAPLEQHDALFGAPGGLYDVFDERGRYLGEVRAPPRARLQTASGDTVWGFEFGEMDEAWVVAYRVARE